MDIFCNWKIAVFFAVFMMVIINVTRFVMNVKVRRPSLIIIFPLVTIISVIAVIPIFMLLPFLKLYREVIKQYLKLRYGTQFTELVGGFNVLHASSSKENSFICIFMMFEYDHSRYGQYAFEIIKAFFDENVVKNEKLSKFHSVFRSISGYMYLIKEKVTANECIKKMKRIDCDGMELNKAQLNLLLQEHYSMPLPKNNELLFDISIGTQPVQWKTNLNKNIKYYPTLLRFHHATTDGLALVELLAGVLAQTDNYTLTARMNYKASNKTSILDQITTYIISSIYAFLFLPSHLLLDNVEKDCNILHGAPFSNCEIIASVLDESGNYLKKIKRIKNKIPNTSFSDVLLTAFSASLANYFEKHSPSLTASITVVIPLLRNSLQLQSLPLGHLEVEDINFDNKFVITRIRLPISIKIDNDNADGASQLQRLQLIKKCTQNINNSLLKVTFFCTHVLLPLLPVSFVSKLLAQTGWTSLVSIVPGPPKICVADGVLPIDNLIFWTPHLNNVGLNISFFTYDNKIQIGLNADNSVIPTEIEAKSIVDGIEKYLNILEDEADKNKME